MTAWSPLIVTVAPNGARRQKADHPALPMTPAELAACAVACRDSGAAMIHLHVRDREGRHTLDVDAYRDAIGAIRDAVGDGLVIQATTEAVGRYAPAEQMAMVRELRPEAVSLAIREIVPEPGPKSGEGERQAAAFLAWLRSEAIMAQYILYSADDVRRFRDLCRRDIVPGERHAVLFVLGRYSADGESDPADLLPFLAALDEDVRDLWAVCAFGARESACVLAAAAFGGHPRVGFENNVRLADGALAPDNSALVAQARSGAVVLGRPLADASMAREAFSRLVA